MNGLNWFYNQELRNELYTVFDPVALSEYEKAVAWYKERCETAAQNLAAEVNERIKEYV